MTITFRVLTTNVRNSRLVSDVGFMQHFTGLKWSYNTGGVTLCGV